MGGRKVVDAGTKAVLGRRCEAASRVVVVWRGWVRGKFGVLGGNKAACRAEVELTSFSPKLFHVFNLI